MTLKELKDYITSLPERLDDYVVVNGELVMMPDGETLALVNYRVHTVNVDEHTKEIQIFHQSENDVKDLLMDRDNDGDS